MRSLLPKSVPSHSLVLVSRCRQVTAPFWAPSKAGCGTLARHAGVEVRQQAVRHREPGEDGEVALGHAEGHVGALRVAPFGHALAALEDDARRPAARGRRADHGVVRRRLEEAALQMRQDVARPGRLMRRGELGRAAIGRRRSMRGGLRPGQLDVDGQRREVAAALQVHLHLAGSMAM
jgi:hypothetical protein